MAHRWILLSFSFFLSIRRLLSACLTPMSSGFQHSPIAAPYWALTALLHSFERISLLFSPAKIGHIIAPLSRHVSHTSILISRPYSVHSGASQLKRRWAAFLSAIWNSSILFSPSLYMGKGKNMAKRWANATWKCLLWPHYKHNLYIYIYFYLSPF